MPCTEKLDPLGLSVAGGRVSGVGVGGLTLGGGISYFGPREGWTCNQVTSFEVVLADGSVVQATSEKNADLWWGLRGGSHNFGIVTRMTLPTFEQGLLWYSMTLNPLSEVDNQARIYGGLMAAENYDVNASFLTGWAYVGAQNLSVTLNQLIYTRPAGNDTPAVFQPVLDLPAISYSSTSSTVIGTALTLAKNSAAIQLPQAARYMTATSTFVPTEAMIRATYEAFQASLPLLQNVTGIMWAVNIEPLPPQLYTRNGADTNAFGLDNDGGSLAVFLISPSWSDGAQDEIVYGAARSLLADIEARAKALGVFHPYIYLNYAAPWQDPIASYGEASVTKLRALRKRVDPKEVFTRKLAGGFKIPEVSA
ncbi:hypothetical protein EKO27_g8599 [Xylaria grammica]|uniref:FAD-binding PCMH-type domain-containing protein n=1 Tax=Xylaria grammica TaxID=363999 RepID=A0A439CWH7_9PEZI|nr:hypothetical protein EKO27_g8599 [Xylaria grammica]